MHWSRGASSSSGVLPDCVRIDHSLGPGLVLTIVICSCGRAIKGVCVLYYTWLVPGTLMYEAVDVSVSVPVFPWLQSCEGHEGRG
jgi:hypothetical protein